MESTKMGRHGAPIKARAGRHRAPAKAAGITVASALTIGFAGGGMAAMSMSSSSAASTPTATFTSSANPAAPALMKGTWVSANTDRPKGYTQKKLTVPNLRTFTAHNFVSSNGDVGICAQDSKGAPTLSPTNAYNPYTAYTHQRFVTGAYSGSEGKYTARETEELAYILSQSKWATSLTDAKTPVNYTAIDYVAGQMAGNGAHHTLPATNAAAVKSTAAAMLAEASKYAGPYKMTVKGSGSTPEVGKSYGVTFSVQTQGTGVIVPGQVVTATVTDGTFADGTKTKTVTTTTKASTLEVKYTKAGEKPKVTFSAKVAARGLWLQSNGKSQDVFKVGDHEKLGGSIELLAAAKPTPTPTPSTSSPTPSTTTPAPQTPTPSLTTVAKQTDKEVWDTGTGKGYPALTPISGTDTAYVVPNGTHVEVGTIPAEAKILKTVEWHATSNANGEVVFETEKLPNPGPGFTVYWVESSKAGSSDKTTWPAVEGKFGAIGESTSMEKPKTPTPTPTPSTTTPAPKAPTPNTPAPKPHIPVPGPRIQTG